MVMPGGEVRCTDPEVEKRVITDSGFICACPGIVVGLKTNQMFKVLKGLGVDDAGQLMAEFAFRIVASSDNWIGVNGFNSEFRKRILEMLKLKEVVR